MGAERLCTLQVDQWIVIQPNQSLERVPSVRSWADADVWPSGAGGLLPGAVLSLPHDHSLSPEVPRPSALSPTDVPKPSAGALLQHPTRVLKPKHGLFT